MPEFGRSMDVIRARWEPRKLALVRVLRGVRLDGSPGTPEDNAWLAVKAALAAQPPEVQEDWDLLARVPRLDPFIIGFAAVLGVPDPVFDAIFRAATEIDT